MSYTNSSMVAYTKLSQNHSGLRTHSIDRITPHCVVGQCSIETLGDIFYPKSYEASCQYGIGKDGRVGMYVQEKNCSWCSSSNENDQRAVTIECASDTTAPYAMNDKVYATLIKLCTDICKRNGKKKLLWLGNKSKTLSYTPKSDEMILTVHRWFANKSCPGDWLYSRLDDLASKVTAAIKEKKDTLYRVRKTWADSKSQIGAYKVLSNAKAAADKNPGYSVFDSSGKKIYSVANSTGSYKCPFNVRVSIPDLHIRKGAGTNYAKAEFYTGIGVFTITEVKSGTGSTKGWGRLKSGSGWISLDYCTIL